MSTPPSNYNPNESLLNGGTDATIMKVMGGGGSGELNGYNETQSLLNGGLDAVIEKIEGGADTVNPDNTTLSNIEFVDYKNSENKEKDEKEFKALETVIINHTNISVLTTRLYNATVKRSKNIFRYINNNDILEKTSLNNSTDEQIIHYIPSTVRYIITVPPIENPYDLFIFIKFLLVGDLCFINETNNYILKKGVFIIFLNISIENSTTLKFMYYKFLSTNITKCILITEKEKAILFFNDKIVGFTSNDTDKFYLPLESETLDITQKDLIYEYGIKAVKYNKNSSTYENIEIIKAGNNDTENSTDFNISLKTKVLIIKLKELDIVYTKIDLYGKYYKLRVPRFRDQSDTIFKSWTIGKYEPSEKQLVDDLQLSINLSDNSIEIANFLYYLSYYKCFDDVSLLTKQECKEMRTLLETIYKKIVENRNKSQNG